MKKVIIVVGFIVVVVAASVGVKVAYDSGYREAEKVMEIRVEKLAEAVEEKAKISTVLSEIRAPEELNDETVDDYLLEIQAAEEKIQDEKISGMLAEYREKWADFKVIFASQDNELISKTVLELQTAAEETAGNIKELLDQRIAEY